MNRSIFQIWRLIFSKKLLYNFVISSLILIIVNLDANLYNCFDVRGNIEPFLRETYYRGIFFKCSKNISDEALFKAIDAFKNNNTFVYNVAKFYEIKNGACVPFHPKSCYTHPNFFVGTFNNLHLNFQFSHHNNYFKSSEFFATDLFNLPNCQFINMQAYFYNNNLGIQYLNQNSLNLNKHIVYPNVNQIEIQSFIEINTESLNNFVNNSKNNIL